MLSVRPEARIAASAGSKGTKLPFAAHGLLEPRDREREKEREREREKERGDGRELGGKLSRRRPSPKSVSRGDEPEMAANARKRLTITSLAHVARGSDGSRRRTATRRDDEIRRGDFTIPRPTEALHACHAFIHRRVRGVHVILAIAVDLQSISRMHYANKPARDSLP